MERGFFNATSTMASGLLPLSPAFLTEEDAARHIHRQLDSRERDTWVVAFIVQRVSDSYYYVSRLLREQDWRVRDGLFEKGLQGQLLSPVGYRLKAYFIGSTNEAFQAARRQFPDLTEEQVKRMGVNFFSRENIAFAINNWRESGFSIYSSGMDNALFKYTAEHSDATQDFADWVHAGSPLSDPRSDEGEGGIVRKALALGTLTVLSADYGWAGSVGVVPPEWRPNVAFDAAPLAPAYGPLQSSVQDALQDISRMFALAGDVAQMAFILKQVDRDEFFATVPVQSSKPFFDWVQVLPMGADGQPAPPPGFRIEALFYNGVRAGPLLSKLQDWLSERFFSPAQLAGPLDRFRKHKALFDEWRGLTLYLAPKGGALLSYRYSESSTELKYLASHNTHISPGLKDGSLTPNEFVLAMAELGRLAVLRTGEVWDRAGPVSQAWRPLEGLHQSLSPVFATADDAARYAHFQSAHLRLDEHRGYVLRRADGKFQATPAVVSKVRTVGWDQLLASGLSERRVELPGYEFAAKYVTTPDWKARIKVKEPAWSEQRIDLFVSLPGFENLWEFTLASETILDLYICGPDGSLIKYTRSRSEEELNFNALLKRGQDTGVMSTQLDGYDSSPETLVKKLARVGKLSVVVSSPVWKGSRGQVPADWVAYQPYTATAPLLPAFSWVFQDALTAAFLAHDGMVRRSNVPQIVFMLKREDAQAFIVSDPIAVADHITGGPLALEQVFSLAADGTPHLPPGYALSGVCYLSLPAAERAAGQPWLYESFVAPLELAHFIAVTAKNKPGTMLFLSTRDGAQLRYVSSATPAENELYGITPQGVVTDNDLLPELRSGALTSQAYVQKVAAAGELSVVQEGTLWDVLGPVDERWKPFARYFELTMSREFVQADDAARYAHEQIGPQRDRVLAGGILQTTEGRFVATLPVTPKDQRAFAPDALFPTDHQGVAILPQGHTLYAMYASCTALSLLDTRRMALHGWSREQASIDHQLFSEADLRNIIQNRHLIAQAYFSNAETSLLAYQTSGSDAELQLLKEVVAVDNVIPMARDLLSGAIDPQRVVKQLAQAGALRIVIASPLWGEAGVVAGHWAPGRELEFHKTPGQVAFGALFSSAADAARDAHVRAPRGYGGPAQTHYGFILKHKNDALYMVSQLIPSNRENPLFVLNSVFAVDESGKPGYPQVFELYGLFYTRQWVPEGLSVSEAWLARHFISSQDLYEGFFAAKRWREAGAIVTLPLYISTQDNALLSYQTPLSTQLFDAQKASSGIFEDVHSRLASGLLTASEFVGQVASQCWLSVIVGNECWDEPGKLGADWQPYADFSRRALTPAFTTQADAVRCAHRLWRDRRDALYGGLVVRRADGLFVATEPMPVPCQNFSPSLILPDDVRLDLLVPGTTLVARYRTCADVEPDFPLIGERQRDIYRTMLPTRVLTTAVDSAHRWTHEYLFGLDGSVIGFSLSDPDGSLMSPREKGVRALKQAQLKGQLKSVRKSPNQVLSCEIEQQMREGLLTPEQYVSQVMHSGCLEVLQGSELWGSARRINTAWQPGLGFVGPELTHFALADRQSSPVFQHADDAMRYIHEQLTDRSTAPYGLVLKTARGRFFASLPVQGEDRLFPMTRVFEQGQLPVGTTVIALYVGAPMLSPAEAAQRPVYRSFISPSLLLQALHAVTRTTPARNEYLPLYVSHADGALLRYDASVLDVDWSSFTLIEAYLHRNKSRTQPEDYVHKLARAGDLQVLVKGGDWTSLGRVSQSWTAGAVSTNNGCDDDRLPLGALFSHPDDAARSVWRRYGRDSDGVYLSAVVRNHDENTFFATEPQDDSGPSVPVGLRLTTPAYKRLFGGVMNLRTPQASVKYPDGFTVVGVQQLNKIPTRFLTYPNRYEQALLDNFIEHREFRVFVDMLKDDNVVGARYYFTPRKGALLVYRPSYNAQESEFLLSGWVDSVTEVMKVAPSQVIGTVSTVGKLNILEPDEFWQPRSHVATRFLLELRSRSRRTDT